MIKVCKNIKNDQKNKLISAPCQEACKKSGNCHSRTLNNWVRFIGSIYS